MANTKIVIDCENADHAATIEFTHVLAVEWKWKVLEGEEVWGSPAEGTVGSDIVNGNSGQLMLGNSDVVFEDFRPLEVGKKGNGDRISVEGGSFPLGGFKWECSKLE